MKTYKEYEKQIIRFFKDAFCVDGEVKIMKKIDDLKIKAIVELNDSKRGKFYIGYLEKETKK